MFYFFFFFSSRRRHTRWNCDWSSDVCSSDLAREDVDVEGGLGRPGERLQEVLGVSPLVGAVRAGRPLAHRRGAGTPPPPPGPPRGGPGPPRARPPPPPP